MSKKCIRCGAELPDHAKFCDKCGAAVSEQKQPCYCQKCGAKLDPGTKFCGSCGTPVGGSTGQEFQQFADNAKAAAQAGMDSAKKGAAKGMAYAAEKMAAAAEKMKQQTTDAPKQDPAFNFSSNDNTQAQAAETAESNSAAETFAPEKKKSSVRTILISIGVAVLILFAIIMMSGGGATNTVKNGTLNDYPDTTVGEAFEERFTNGEWSSTEREGSTYVIFEGSDPETISDWEIEFKVSEDRFRVESITVDGVYYADNISTSGLIDYIYTGDYDLLLGYAFLDALLS